jgi:hypothetical protein
MVQLARRPSGWDRSMRELVGTVQGHIQVGVGFPGALGGRRGVKRGAGHARGPWDVNASIINGARAWLSQPALV